jgi:hypothetical protein
MRLVTKFFTIVVRPVQASWRERGRIGLYIFFKLQLGDFELELSNGSLQPWTHFCVHKHDYDTHIVAGRLSISFGMPGLEPVTCCAACGEPTTGLNAGDEYLTYCEGCQQLEPDTVELLTKDIF